MSVTPKQYIGTPPHIAYHRQFVTNELHDKEDVVQLAHSYLIEPVMERMDDPSARIVGFLQTVLSWERYFVNLLPVGVNGVTLIFQNNCGQLRTYTLTGGKVSLVAVVRPQRFETR
jgi:hypothetical protein